MNSPQIDSQKLRQGNSCIALLNSNHRNRLKFRKTEQVLASVPWNLIKLGEFYFIFSEKPQSCLSQICSTSTGSSSSKRYLPNATGRAKRHRYEFTPSQDRSPNPWTVINLLLDHLEYQPVPTIALGNEPNFDHRYAAFGTRGGPACAYLRPQSTNVFRERSCGVDCW